MKIEILGTLIDQVDMASALQKIETFIAEGIPHHVITLNAEIIYRAQFEPELRAIINRAALVTPDGAGVVWASRYLKKPVPERVTGIDLLQAIAARASTTGWRLFLLGGAPGVAEEAAANLKKRFTNLNIVGTHHGYWPPTEEEAIVALIRSARPDVLFVALGAPRQEYWISRHLSVLGVPVCMGVGGSFDVLAGRVKRAPKWMQQLQLEWLARLVQEPFRWRRMLALPKFMFQVMRSKR